MGLPRLKPVVKRCTASRAKESPELLPVSGCSSLLCSPLQTAVRCSRCRGRHERLQEMGSFPWLALPDFRSPVADDLFHVLLQPFQARDLMSECPDLLFEHPQHLLARNSAPISGAQNLGKLCKREAEPQSVTNHFDPFQAFSRIHPVARRAPRRFGQDTQPLIVPQCIGTHPRCTG